MSGSDPWGVEITHLAKYMERRNRDKQPASKTCGKPLCDHTDLEFAGLVPGALGSR